MNPTSEQYHQRASAFRRANPEMEVIIRGNAKGEDLKRQGIIKDRWFTYLHVRGQATTISLYRTLLNENRNIVFPCECPTMFDSSYVPPANLWRERQGSAEPRKDASQIIKQTASELQSAAPSGRQQAPKEDSKVPEKTPDEWLAAYAAKPPALPALSDEARANFVPPLSERHAAA